MGAQARNKARAGGAASKTYIFFVIISDGAHTGIRQRNGRIDHFFRVTVPGSSQCTLCWPEGVLSMSLPDVITAALERIQHIAKTETIIGEPVCAGNVTLIPVSKISVGFAAGGAGGNQEKSGSGSGTGGGINVIPVAFIAIIDDRVEVHPIERAEIDLQSLLVHAPDLLKRISKYFRKKGDSASETVKDTDAGA
jgi:uncharacterized spore protein YtfJ